MTIDDGEAPKPKSGRAGWTWTVASVVLAAVMVGIGLGIVNTFAGATAELLGGFLATLAGVVAGVPVALALAEEGRAAQRNELESERNDERRHLAELIESDLADALTRLGAPIRQRRRQGVVPFLETGLWSVLKASGSVGLIDDHRVLREVSRAYDKLSVTAYQERLVWELYQNPAAHMATSPPQHHIEDALEVLASLDAPTEAAIENALSELRQWRGRIPR